MHFLALFRLFLAYFRVKKPKNLLFFRFFLGGSEIYAYLCDEILAF